MRFTALSPFGAEVSDVDLATATEDEIQQIGEFMQSEKGRGVLVVRNQDLPPETIERVLFKFAPRFGAPLKYERWPGQSKGVEGCPHLAMLGNYRARADKEFGVDCVKGERIGEFKPAQNVVEEWHTDGSFLREPKAAICLYAPDIDDALPPVGAATRFASTETVYEQLTDAEKAEVDGMGTVHSWEVFMRFLEARDPSRPKVTAADIAKKPDCVWPLVRTHPDTGRRCLYLNP